VANQLRNFASLNASPSWRAQASKENAAKILQHAEGRLFEAADVEADLGLSRNIVYPALRRLVAEKLTQLKLRPMGAFGHTLVKQCVSVPAVDAECDEAMSIRVGLKRLDAAEVQARLDSRQAFPCSLHSLGAYYIKNERPAGI